MPKLSVPSRRLLRWIPALTLGVLLLLAACAPEQYPQTTLLPRANTARDQDHLFRLTLWWALVVFVLVEGALLIAIWKFRSRPDAPEPVQTHGNTTLEIVWTIIPAFILAMIAVPTVRTIFKTAAKPVGDDVLQVEVIGHQWWWEFRYPQLGITTASELKIPMGRTVNLEMTTVDVLHSFWLPQFAGKRDVFPNRYNNLWFKADVTGNFPAQCTEFCGIQHGRMAYRIVSLDGPAFDAWAANFNAPPRDFVADSTASALVKQGQGAVRREGLQRLSLDVSGTPAHWAESASRRQPESYRRRHAGEYRREPGQVDPESAGLEEGRPDAEPRSDG